MIKIISYTQAINFLIDLHYSGRKPVISYAFGLYEYGNLVAVCTYGTPASRSLCVGILGKENYKCVIELNRLCRLDNVKTSMSQFIAHTLRELRKYNLCVVSYADTQMSHCGYVYQACNFLYTGKTKSRTDKYVKGNKHSRHYKEEEQGQFRKIRSAKHRYVHFTGDKRFKKNMLKQLRYPLEKYPKEENMRYVLGDFIQPKLVKI